VAAALAWYVAHDLLGHQQPFFAPIAAAIALSTNQVQRARRTAQMVGGVLLGIAVAELAHPIVGGNALAIGVVALIAFLLAAGFGFSFFGEGMMFANQCAASAILVITLHRAGTGSERATDALVGGACALLIGVVMFPVEPMGVLAGAEQRVLRCLLDILEGCARLLARTAGDGNARDAALAAGARVHAVLTGLTLARRTARGAVRVAPRRMRQRQLIDAEAARTERLYVLAGGTLAVLRAALGAHDTGPPPASCGSLIAHAAAIVRLLAEHPPRSPATVREALAATRELIAEPLARDPPSAVLLSGAVHVLGVDVLELLGPERAPRPAARATI